MSEEKTFDRIPKTFTGVIANTNIPKPLMSKYGTCYIDGDIVPNEIYKEYVKEKRVFDYIDQKFDALEKKLGVEDADE